MGWWQRQPAHRQWACIAVLAVLVSGYNVARSLRCDAVSGCVSSYWISFWLIAYEDGYERRALLGQLCRWLFGGQLPFQALNAGATGVALALWVTGVTLLMRGTRGQPELHRAVLLAVVMGGPTTTVLAEVLGDPLQLSCLLTLAYASLAPRWARQGRNTLRNTLMAALCATLAVMAHEAALFVCVPVVMLAWAWSSGRELRPWPLLAIMLMGLALVAVFNHQPQHGEGAALITRTGSLWHPPAETLPGFKQLLQEEWQAYFGTATGPMKLGWKLLRTLGWPVALVLGLCQLMRAWPVARLFAWQMALAAPLYVIAHDWGRFVVYTTWLTLAMYGIYGARQPLNLRTDISWLTTRAERLTQAMLPHAPVLLLLLLIYRPYDGYRIWGLSDKSTLLLLAATGLALAWQRRLRP